MSRILIAEDDEAMREFLTQVLIRQGHTVKAVSNGAEALKTMNGYDLLLSDMVGCMPSISAKPARAAISTS